MGDTKREASSPEVASLRQENVELKQLVAELSLQNRGLKKVRVAGAAEGRQCGLQTAIMGNRERSPGSVFSR